MLYPKLFLQILHTVLHFKHYFKQPNFPRTSAEPSPIDNFCRENIFSTLSNIYCILITESVTSASKYTHTNPYTHT